MLAGYYQQKIKKHEWVLPLAFSCLILFSALEHWLAGTDTAFSLIVVFLCAGLLSVSFFFPRIFYLLNIDFGNISNGILWLVVVLLFAFCFSTKTAIAFYLTITKIPLVMYLYMHAMRALHYGVTKQLPAFGANYFTKGDSDKFANRKISGNDIGFNVLYAAIPILGLIIAGWLKKVGG